MIMAKRFTIIVFAIMQFAVVAAQNDNRRLVRKGKPSENAKPVYRSHF